MWGYYARGENATPPSLVHASGLRVAREPAAVVLTVHKLARLDRVGLTCQELQVHDRRWLPNREFPMIQKSEQQEIDRKGRRLLKEALESLGWVSTGFEEDYGIDNDVQVFSDGSATGVWFKLQLKSSESSNRSTDGSFVSVQLDLDHAKHYALELRDPVFLVHADVQTNEVFWYAPQLDNDLIEKLQAGENVSSVTVRVPTSNALPATAAKLLETLELIYVVLGHRTLVASTMSSFAKSLKHQPGQDKIREEFYRRADFLRFEKIQGLILQREYGEARSRAQLIVSDPDSSIENRFWAQEVMGTINWSEAVSKGHSQPDLPLILLENAKALQKIAKDGPARLKLFARISRKAAELDKLVNENWGLTILLHQHRTLGNPIMALSAFGAHALNTRAVISKYNECLRLANYASNFPERWFLPRALAKIPSAAASFIGRVGRMEEMQMGDQGVQFQSSMLQICKLIAWIGEESGDQEPIALAIGSALLTARSTESEAYKWAIMTRDRITDSSVKASASTLIERQMMRWKGQRPEGDYNPEPYQQIMENAAAAIGLDISDKNSALFRGIQIAARDNSPERVLRTCEHIVTSLGATGPIAQHIAALLGTQMAGSKVVHCSLHDYHLEAKDFDSALAAFKAKYCDSCPDRVPRPNDWKFRDAIRRELEAKHEGFIKKFNSTGAGFRFTTSD
jgi:hypothetical protein